MGLEDASGSDPEDRVISLDAQLARPGRPVRVKEGYRKTDLVGMRGTVQHCWGHPDYPALDILLDDGRSKLFWFHQLEATEGRATPSFLNRLLRR